MNPLSSFPQFIEYIGFKATLSAGPDNRSRNVRFIEKGMIRTFYDKGEKISLMCFAKMILLFGKRAAYTPQDISRQPFL
jgi:hypothetical protein